MNTQVNASSDISSRFLDNSFSLPCEILIIVVASIANTIMIVSIYCHRNLRTIPNLIILNLSFADFLFSAIVVPLHLFVAYGTMTSQAKIICVITGVGTVIFCFVSIYTLAFVSVERYMATNYPVKHRIKFNTKLVKIVLLLIWFCGALLSALSFAFSEYVYLRLFFHCSINWTKNLPTTLVYLIVILLPLVILAYCNIYTLRAMWNRTRSGASNSTSLKNLEKIRLKREYRFCVIIIVLIITCFVCWVPYCLAMVSLASGEITLPETFMIITKMLPPLNSACNPIIYGVLNKNFRAAFKAMLRCR